MTTDSMAQHHLLLRYYLFFTIFFVQYRIYPFVAVNLGLYWKSKVGKYSSLILHCVKWKTKLLDNLDLEIALGFLM